MLFVAALVAAATGCSSKADKTPAATSGDVEAKVPTVTVDEVDVQIASGKCQAVDANGDTTRKRMGVLPGAVLLTDSDDFKLAELPTDKAKPLVFYCSSTECSASHHAAAKAMTAGYTNVKVMPDGIAGWVKAGKHTQQI